MNCLANPATVAALMQQATLPEGVYERVYSSFDGRIYLTRQGITAYSWSECRTFDAVQPAVRWLLQEARKRADYFKELQRG